MKPDLIVTVDTEEEGLWSGKFPVHDSTVENVQGIPRFQRICEDLGIAPTYLVNSPVVTDESAAALLREILVSGECEIGAHIHPWNTPPIVGSYDSHGSYLCNLTPDVQKEKLRVITGQINDAFDVAPKSFRAGRYGLDGKGAAILSELGYLVDSSVCPFTDYSADGGPDFRGAPFRPYWADSELMNEGKPVGVLEVPVSFGFNRANFEFCFRLHEFLQRGAFRRMRAIGVLDRLRVLQKIKFSPEKGDAARLIRVVNAYVKNEAPCLVMMFHSSSLQPGHTPYVESSRQLDAFLSNLRECLEYCVSQLEMRPRTLTGFASLYATRSEAAQS